MSTMRCDSNNPMLLYFPSPPALPIPIKISCKGTNLFILKLEIKFNLGKVLDLNLHSQKAYKRRSCLKIGFDGNLGLELKVL